MLQEIINLQHEVELACQQLKIVDKVRQIAELELKQSDPTFWQNAVEAQEISQTIATLHQAVDPWVALTEQLKDAVELAGHKDQSMTIELKQQLVNMTTQFADLKKQLRFVGKYDQNHVIMSIYAGAGGTDAQDWAAMLLRMYSRWAEKSNQKLTLLDESAGEQAGIKSVTLSISGQDTYGLLKSENGVHRLVRLSPFNAGSLRQTSFAKVEVIPKIDKPSLVPLDEKDLRIDVYRSGGKGGQSVNTTDSAVRISHLPTGIVVAIQNERSQLQNKETALTIIRSKLAQLQLEQHADNVSSLKGPNEQAAWGNQIRSYVIHPYKMVKDLRTRHETSDTQAVLDGNIQPFIDSYLSQTLGQ